MLLLFFLYLSLFTFLALSVNKFFWFARMPLHGRWELYPVPREPAERACYGGSYYEEPEWWKKPRKISRAGEIKKVFKEMFFIRRLFINQRRHWWFSYSLHSGIYWLILWGVFLLAGAVIELSGPVLITGGNGDFWSGLVYFGTLLSGGVGVLLLTAGSAGLFLRRMFNRDLNKYSNPQDYFNLLFILAVAVSGLVVWNGDPGFNYGREILKAMLAFAPVKADTALTVHILLLGALLIYIPQTKMSHYVCKFFSFHKVLWDNEPNLRNSKIERKIKRNLSNKPPVVTWAAPHTGNSEQLKEFGEDQGE